MARVLGNRYALYDAFAAGGMARVHLGRMLGHVGYARTVAIKQLLPHLAADAEFVMMFVDEARVATRIRHPNVVPTLDVVVADGDVFIVLEYVHGEPLSKLLAAVASRDEYAPMDVVSAIVIDMLHGLHAAHEAKDERGGPLGIVHRDVSPQNLIVGTDGSARVVDFGVAKAMGRLASTHGPQVKGKIAYMAPEQLLGNPIDARADVYAASVVLWHAIAGKKLFAGATEAETVGQILAGDVQSPSRARGPAGARGFEGASLVAIDRVVLRGLARNPDERYATAREMAEALAAAGPVASRTDVGDWVERIARDDLDARTRLIVRIETDESFKSSPSGSDIVQEVRTSGTWREGSRAPGASAGPDGSEPTRIPLSKAAKATKTANGAPGSPARRSAIRLSVAAAAVAAIFGFGLWRVTRERGAAVHASTVLDAQAGGADGATRPRAITDWPEPTTKSSQATMEYRAALQALRSGARGDVQKHLRRAVEADPTYASADLRLSLYARVFGVETERRQAFSRALKNRSRLDERDATILHVFEPSFTRDPPDTKETIARLAELAARSPEDAELAYLLGLTGVDAGQLERARVAFERATVLDPLFAYAWSDLAGVLLDTGHAEAALVAADRCVAVSPIATGCVSLRYDIHSSRGDCAAAEADARQLLAADPDSPQGYTMLAVSLAAQDRPLPLVRAALDQRARFLPAVDKPRELRLGRVGLAALAGDFAGAEAILQEIERLRAGDNGLASRADTAHLLVQLREESGRGAAARETAEHFLQQYDILLPSAGVGPSAMANDPYPWMLGVLRRNGRMTASEVAAKRDAWLAKWRAKAAGDYQPYLWTFGYAMSVVSQEDAVAAIGKMPEFGPLPLPDAGPVADAAAGRVYLLARRPADALPAFRRAARSCEALIEPFEQTQATFGLATALEQTGDRDAACVAYARVARRWERARPKSVTAEAAKARAAAIGCK